MSRGQRKKVLFYVSDMHILHTICAHTTYNICTYYIQYVATLGFSYRAPSMLYNKSYQLMRLL